MIMTKTSDGWVCILQPENLARMKQGDPVTIPDLNITICYEEVPTEKLIEKLQFGAMKYLTRGWQNHPDDYGKAVKIGTFRP